MWERKRKKTGNGYWRTISVLNSCYLDDFIIQIMTIMKKIAFALLIIGLHCVTFSQSQTTSPYLVKRSQEFKSPKKHKILSPIGYGKEGIIQVNAKGLESFSFQKFSSQLELQKENNVLTENRVPKGGRFERIVTTKNKSYLFIRNEHDGIDALEFFPEKLDFADHSVPLFQTSGKIRTPKTIDWVEYGWGWNSGVLSTEDLNTPKMYNFVLSGDKTKFMYNYTLVPKSLRDNVNKDVVEIYVYDEHLNKLWGGEYTMPYTVADMDNLRYTLSNDGKVYLLAKVYGNKDRVSAVKKGGADYHYEVLVYQKDNPLAKAIELRLDNYFPQEAYIYEDIHHNLVVAGFYSKSENEPIDGVYMVKLETDNSKVTRLNGGFYEIPASIIKAYTSEREKRAILKRENKGKNIGIWDLKIREITTTPNGSVKIVSEQYRLEYTRSSYYYGPRYGYYGVGMMAYPNAANTRVDYTIHADDIFVFSINSSGKLEWVKKIPKAQIGHDKSAPGLSLVTYFTGDDIHLFYVDNIKNQQLSINESPYIHQDYKGGFLTGIRMDAQGNLNKYNLGAIKEFKTNLYIRYFVDGGNNNLISTERKRKKNTLYSIEINPNG
jgi:hypothetical protein